MPEGSLQHHQALSKHSPPVEDAITVCVFQPQHTMLGVFLLLSERRIGAARLRDVEPALFVERTGHRPFHQGRGSHPFDDEPRRHGQGKVTKLKRRGSCGERRRQPAHAYPDPSPHSGPHPWCPHLNSRSLEGRLSAVASTGISSSSAAGSPADSAPVRPWRGAQQLPP